MTDRLTTVRNGQIGLWLSVPGVNVRTASERNLLISPDFKNLSFLINGVAVVPAGSHVTVQFGEALSDPPFVKSGYFFDQKSYSPPLTSMLTFSDTPQWRIEPTASNMRIVNRIGDQYRVRYLVLGMTGRA